MGKTNCGNKELAFLASAIKKGRTSRRRRLQMPTVSIKRPKTMFEFGSTQITFFELN